MLLDECFMYDYGLVDATEEASDKKEVSDKMCEKALELRAAELELEEAKANLKEANESLVGTAGEMREELQEEQETATTIVIEAEKALKKLNKEFKSTLEAWKKVVRLGQGELEAAFEDEAKMKRTAYHSCSFVGNDVDRALDKHCGVHSCAAAPLREDVRRHGQQDTPRGVPAAPGRGHRQQTCRGRQRRDRRGAGEELGLAKGKPGLRLPQQ